MTSIRQRMQEDAILACFFWGHMPTNKEAMFILGLDKPICKRCGKTLKEE